MELACIITMGKKKWWRRTLLLKMIWLYIKNVLLSTYVTNLEKSISSQLVNLNSKDLERRQTIKISYKIKTHYFIWKNICSEMAGDTNDTENLWRWLSHSEESIFILDGLTNLKGVVHQIISPISNSELTIF